GAVLAGLPGWTEGRLDDLRPGSPLLDAPLPDGWADRQEPASPCPVLALPPGARLDEAVPAGIARKVRYYRRRGARSAAMRFEAADTGNLEELLAALFALHGARWAARGGPGVLADPAVRAFHAEAAEG